MKSYKYILISLVAILPWCMQAQTENDTIIDSKIFVEHAKNSIVDNTGDEVARYFVGDVRMYHDSVYMFCDSAVIRDNKLTAVGNVAFVQSDTIKMFADSLLYYGDSGLSKLYDNVIIENGTQQLFTESLLYNTREKWATYQDTALLKDGNARLQSIKGRYDINQRKAIFYREVVVKKEGMTLRSDSLEFMTEEKKMIFVNPTRIVDADKRIYCERGYYFLENGEALFEGNAQYIENKTVATADQIFYTAQDSTVNLIGDAFYKSDQKTAKAEEILYESKSKKTTLIGEAEFLDGLKKTTGDTLIYDERSGAMKIKGRGVINDPPTILIADEVDYDDVLGVGIATGNVLWQDTSARTDIFSEKMIYNDTENSVMASGTRVRPYMVKYEDLDTMYLAADSLFSFEQIAEDSLGLQCDTIRKFHAYNRVNIIRSSLRANCDSLVYNDQDSVFMLFNDPVVWSDTTQFSGDTILMQLKNDDISEINIIKSAFMITELEPEVYNQIKGKLINVIFKEGDIDYMDVIGSAESLYYVQDDEQAYIGVDKTLCSHMRFFFKNKELEDIKFYSKPESVLTPAAEINPLTQRLDRFNWQIEKAPINLSSIIAIK